MYLKVEFEDGYVIDKYYIQSTAIIIDDMQINKHGNILRVLIDC